MKNLSYMVVAYVIGGVIVGGYWVYLRVRLRRLGSPEASGDTGTDE